MLQDTLIDLRNLLAIDDEAQNQTHFDNPYQRQLNNSSTPFYYPGIDRSLNVVYSWVRDESIKLHTSLSSEESIYGSGINIYPDSLTDAEIFAACNGSITQIRQLYKHLNLISEMLLEHFENKIYLKDVIRNQLLMGKSYAHIARWITRYSFLWGQLDDNDAMEILHAINSYPIGIERLAIRSTTIRVVGDYLTDAHFNEIWPDVFNEVSSWLAKPKLILQPAKEILGMFRYCFRIPQSNTVDFVDKLSSQAPRYYNDLADIIAGAIDYENADSNIRTQLSSTLKKMIESMHEHSFTNKVSDALISLIVYWPHETKYLVTHLKKNHEQYFNQNILPYLWSKNSNSKYKAFIENQIALMSSQNKQQSGQIVSMFSTDPFANVYESIHNNPLFNELYSSRVLSEIIDNVNNPHQTIDTKQSAIKLLMLMIHNNKTENIDLLDKIDTKNLTAEDHGFFSKNAPTKYVEVLRGFLGIISLNNDNGKLLTILTLEQSAKYLYFVSEMLIDFLPIALTSIPLRNTIPQVLQFLILNNNSHERENKLTTNISKCLITLCSDEEYSDIALGQVQRLVSDTNNVIQRQIVTQIQQLSPERQKLFHSIKAQLLINSSYSVRDLARREFGK